MAGNFNFNLEIGKTEKKPPLENIRRFVFCKIGENMQWVRKKKYFKPPTSQTKFFFKSVTPKVGPNFNGDRLHLARDFLIDGWCIGTFFLDFLKVEII